MTRQRGPALREEQRGWVCFDWIPNFRYWVSCSALILFLASAPREAHAGSPVLEGFFPAGAALGTTTVVAAVGKIDTWPPKVWVSNPGIEFAAQTNKGVFAVVIRPDAVVGPCLVRLYNQEGASEPRMFMVDSGPVIAEAEPNNYFAKPQVISSLPTTIDGRLEKSGDVDSFSLELNAGQWLEADVESHALMSNVDAALRLVTPNGVQLAWNHDFITLDPRLSWRATSNQTVVVQVFGFAYPPASDIRLAGGERAIYRLHLRTGERPVDVCEPATKPDGNNGKDTSPKKLPFSTQGNIGATDEVDRCQFIASQGEIIEACVEAAAYGSPLDAWLRIEDVRGNELAWNDDDEGNRDPRVEWKVSTNATFTVAIGSVTHRGGDDCCYRLFVRRVTPEFRVKVSSNSLTLSNGATNELKIDVKRLRGHTNELIATLHDLPACVTAAATKLPGKDGTAAIEIRTTEGACEFQGPVHVVVTETATGRQSVIPFNLTTRGEAAYTRLPIETSDEFWLTVRAKSLQSTTTQNKK